MLRPVVLYREGVVHEEGEVEAIKKHLPCLTSRMQVQPADLVVGRYGVLPFYKELEQDIETIGGHLINTYRQHCFVADLGNWVDELQELTPRTWPSIDAATIDGPFVLKGATNSKKFLWDTHAFARTKSEAVDVMCRLQDDGLISSQHIYVREYVPLKTYLVGLRGMPVTKEFRLFVCDGQVLSRGYYWSNYLEDLPETPNPDDIPTTFIEEVLRRVDGRVRFYSVDVAQTEQGRWIVIELNDGQMSGLSLNDPEVLYANLARVLHVPMV